MKLVDPRKLADVREIIDSCVAEKAIARTVPRREILSESARELGYALEYFKVDALYVATAQLKAVWDEIELYHFHGDFDRCADVDVASRSSTCAVAAHPELAATAVLVQLLDSEIDVFFNDESYPEFYPFGTMIETEWRLNAVWNYIREERWFGVISQMGRTAEAFEMASSADGKGWRSPEE